jgi:hypothetical protein
VSASEDACAYSEGDKGRGEGSAKWNLKGIIVGKILYALRRRGSKETDVETNTGNTARVAERR